MTVQSSNGTMKKMQPQTFASEKAQQGIRKEEGKFHFLIYTEDNF